MLSFEICLNRIYERCKVVLTHALVNSRPTLGERLAAMTQFKEYSKTNTGNRP